MKIVMTQEEKQLLLIDLCARLPYGVKIHYKKRLDTQFDEDVDDVMTGIDKTLFCCSTDEIGELSLTRVKPYLRPLSSMTEEECKTLGGISATLENKLIEVLPNTPYYIEVAVPDQIDWLNKNMFDYRGLIPMGLALEAKEGMYNI